MPELTEEERCRATALRILQFRWNSAAELRRKLLMKEFPSDIVESTVAKLAAEKWLDDERFAGAFVRSRMRKRVGRLRIKRELSVAGVDGEAITKAIAENVDPAQEREALTAVCRKRLAALTRRHGEGFGDSDEGRNKLTSYLFNKGYDPALVQEVVRDVVREAANARISEGS